VALAVRRATSSTTVAEELILDCFGVNELADILEARARRGLPSGVVTRKQLEVIADEVAGVARKGIQPLRQAALLAEEREHDEIAVDDVADCSNAHSGTFWS
jgi:Cdc6-like AAA superfamily ATPase